ncbi:MAG: aminotransferase class I/II-fold pyridoxal phosphate-dependent enzyme, partial [Prochlorococcaceae cyanobacterium]
MRSDPPRSGPPPAQRLEQVLQPVIPEISGLVRATPGCLSLAQGMVRWGPPAAVAEAVAAALCQDAAERPDLHRYGPMAGDPALLEAIAAGLRDPERGGGALDLDGGQLLVTAGSNMAFNAIAQVITGPGDQVIVPLPYYF